MKKKGEKVEDDYDEDTEERQSEVRAKKPSLTLNMGTKGLLKVTSKPPPMAGQAGCLQGRTGSLSGHPSKQQPRSTLLDLVISQ
ncbi:hypothetical protein J6590_024952 [Homalodisca vitripennis]|nr:hypothetical protein J6590_024952 [Homalodisca vitripennis]